MEWVVLDYTKSLFSVFGLGFLAGFFLILGSAFLWSAVSSLWSHNTAAE